MALHSRLSGPIWLAALVLVVTTVGAMPSARAASLPTLDLKDQDGRQQSLTSLQGRIVVLNFWATWCEPCRDELPMLSKLAADYSGRSVAFIAASIDEAETQPKIASFLSKKKITDLPVWIGADPDTLKRFDLGIRVPATVIFDQDGHVAARIMGEASRKEIASRIDWILGGRSGKAPKLLLKNY